MPVIESGIPIPPSRFGRPPMADFSALAVGDSLLLTGRRISNVCNAARNAGRKLGRTFTTRREGDDVRVWRVS